MPPIILDGQSFTEENPPQKLSICKCFASCFAAVASVAGTDINTVCGAGVAAVILALRSGAFDFAVRAGTCAVASGGVCEGIYLIGKACAFGILVAVRIFTVNAYCSTAAASVAVIDALYGIA